MGIRFHFIILSVVAALFATGCERDMSNPVASLTINNNNALAIWSIYVAPTASPTERSADLLASVTLEPAASKTFTIDTCGQAIDVQAIFANGSEQSFVDANAGALNCGASLVLDIP